MTNKSKLLFIKICSLVEMATPSDSMKNNMYYHGTRNTDAAKSIIKAKSINPPDNKHARGKLAPVVGKAYITPHIKYAQIYGIGADVAGDEYGSEMVRKNGGHAYVFGIHGKDLKDVHPDEDSLGEFAANHHDRKTDSFKPTGVDDHRKRALYSHIRSSMTPKQWQGSKDGDYTSWASGGKRALKSMPDDMKRSAIDMGMHIAHHGSLPIAKAWRVHHSDVPKLKRDGSNFFDHAKEIDLHNPPED